MYHFKSFETVEDLLADESFLMYCSGKDAMLVTQWEDWMRSFPEKKILVAHAKQLLIASLVEMDDEAGNLEELRRRLAGAGQFLLSDSRSQMPSVPRHRERGEKNKASGRGFLWLKVAAAASFMILLTCLWLLKPFDNGGEYLQVSTDKVMSLYLPDSTLMVLNKGTSVRYPVYTGESSVRGVSAGKKVKVFLDKGEAFFRVNETAVSSLIVQTGTGLYVEDIGTEFSVKSYHELAEEAIQVQEGLVNVSRGQSDPVRLEQNQALRINKESGEYTWSKADRLSTSGWTTGNIALYDVRFDEAAAALGRAFDQDVILSDPGLSELRVTILFKTSQDLKDILNTLSVLYNLNVLYEDGDVTIATNEDRR